jgi:radical SAM superfamily enzyme YgiQ (UPF0313 family)
MRILFLQNFWHEHLGTMCLSSFLKVHAHEVAVGIGRDFADFKEKIKTYRPGLIAFSCTTGDHLWAISVAQEIKKAADIPIIMGGPHPTYMPDVIHEPGIDFICVGEGEEAMAELASSLEGGGKGDDVRNIFTKAVPYTHDRIRPLVEDLDALPPPDRSIYYDAYPFIHDNPVKHFMAGRGCVFDCSYCYNHQWKELYHGKGQILRYHRPAYCIEEIVSVKKQYPLGLVVFEDDTFTANRKWLVEFLKEYKEKVRSPFACNVYATTVTEETARLLAEAGCYRVNMGVESGNERLRRVVLNKNIKDEDIIKAARFLHANKIKVLTNNMLGIPGETLEDAYSTVKINIHIKTDYPWCSLLQPYPNTKIAEYAKQCGNNDEGGQCQFKGTFFEESIIDQPDMDKVINLQKLFYLAVKAPWLFPFIKVLIRLPFRWLYHAIFLSTFAYRYMRCHKMTVAQMMIFSLRNKRLYGKPRRAAV